MPCGTRRPGRPTGSPWWAAACSAPWWRGCAPASPAPTSPWSTSIRRAPSLPACWASRFAEPDQAPTDCDIVFHASASAAGLATALRCGGLEATVARAVLVRHGAISRCPLGESFHSRRLRLVSSQVGERRALASSALEPPPPLRGGARLADRPGARRAARARDRLRRSAGAAGRHPGARRRRLVPAHPLSRQPIVTRGA